MHWQVYLGEYLGTAVLVLVSLFFAYMLNFVPEDWMIGTLGIIPLILGIRAIFTDDDEADEAVEQIEGRGTQSLFWTVSLVTIASGGDNLGIYIPYFASLEWGQILVAIAVFTVGVAALCAISYHFSRLPLIAETIEKYEKIIIPVVFIGLGFYIMWENGTIQHFLGA
nr:cadmium resistance transporter [Carnobacterium sp. 1290_CSPC]